MNMPRISSLCHVVFILWPKKSRTLENRTWYRIELKLFVLILCKYHERLCNFNNRIYACHLNFQKFDFRVHDQRATRNFGRACTFGRKFRQKITVIFHVTVSIMSNHKNLKSWLKKFDHRHSKSKGANYWPWFWITDGSGESYWPRRKTDDDWSCLFATHKSKSVMTSTLCSNLSYTRFPLIVFFRLSVISYRYVFVWHWLEKPLLVENECM